MYGAAIPRMMIAMQICLVLVHVSRMEARNLRATDLERANADAYSGQHYNSKAKSRDLGDLFFS